MSSPMSTRCVRFFHPRQGSLPGRAAVLPFVRFHGHDLVPAAQGAASVYHPNPMDAKTIGETGRKHRRRCSSGRRRSPPLSARCATEEFASLRSAIPAPRSARVGRRASGEVRPDVSKVTAAPRCRRRGGQRAGRRRRQGNRSATNRAPSASRCRALPSKIVDPRHARAAAAGEEGLLLVKGPNVMKGYLGQPETTERHPRRLVRHRRHRRGRRGRLHPHHRSAVALHQDRRRDGAAHKDRRGDQRVLGRSAAAVVTAAAGRTTRRKLVAFCRSTGMSREELWEKLNQADLPKLWIPKRENLYPSLTLPVLGSGKVDLRQIKTLAQEKSSATSILQGNS